MHCLSVRHCFMLATADMQAAYNMQVNAIVSLALACLKTNVLVCGG